MITKTNDLTCLTCARTGEKNNFYFFGATILTCLSDLAQVYTVSMANLRGSFSILQGSFWHFGGEIALSPRVFFSPDWCTIGTPLVHHWYTIDWYTMIGTPLVHHSISSITGQ